MPAFRYRDDESISTGTVVGVLLGALAGFAAGMLVAQRVGGLGGLKSRLRGRRRGGAGPFAADEAYSEDEELEEYGRDELEEDEEAEPLEERVLEAFRNDPVLCERAVDIGAIGDATIELSGWVETEAEAEHAVTLAGGVPGVESVVNRLATRRDEARFEDAARRAREGDPALTETRWESNIVGTGRRRQGTSDEPDRHADPRVELEERWLDEPEAVRNAADRMEGLAERRRRRSQPAPDRTGGSPIAPRGVPKADHVAQPLQADRQVSRAEASEVESERADLEDR